VRASCLINNFNYGRYLSEAIESALQQSVPFDEIIVVDDGSTDDSLALLQTRYGADERVKVIAKANGGQLSSLNEGFRASSGELIFLLDADDIYEADYLEQALAYYAEHPVCDFLFCAMTAFDQAHHAIRSYPSSRHLGFSMIQTLYAHRWIGQPTSAISIRRGMLEKVLPLPDGFLDDWRVRADDCIVWGSSLAGAYKCYLDKPLVRYRFHGGNNYNGKSFDYRYQVRRNIAVNKLFDHFKTRFGLQDDNKFHKLAKAEFRTIPKPTFKMLLTYIEIINMFKLRLGKRVEMISSLILTYIK